MFEGDAVLLVHAAEGDRIAVGCPHAYAAGRLCVMLADDGHPFDPTMAEVSEREPEEHDGGMFIAHVYDLASGVSLRRPDDGRNTSVLWIESWADWDGRADGQTLGAATLEIACRMCWRDCVLRLAGRRRAQGAGRGAMFASDEAALTGRVGTHPMIHTATVRQ